MLDMEVTTIETDVSKLKVQTATRDWCTLPYPDHPKGCPNYGKRPECPPQAPMLWDHFDLSRPVCFVIVKFNILNHSTNMLMKHPEWSVRQARCCLYWQGTVRKRLRVETENMAQIRGYTASTLIPEAMGLNVLRTMNRLGIPVKRKPECFVYKISMLGYKKPQNSQRGTYDEAR